MKELVKLYTPTFNWLAKKPLTRWSKSHFQTFPKSDMLLKNLCKSFNSMILDARDKPVISTLENYANANEENCSQQNKDDAA